MENKEKKNFLKSKLFLFAVLPIFVLGSVFAVGYLVNSIVFNVGVAEPFTVQYAVLGDTGTYVTGDCKTATNWFTSASANIPVGNMYPLESRKVCVKIHNAGEVDIPYTISSQILKDNEAKDCLSAFGTYSLNGNAVALIDSFDGVVVTPSANSTPVSGCQVQVSVLRG
jgi:hypothetical protein